VLRIVEEYEARARALREAAETMRQAEAREALIRYALDYEARAAAMRGRREEPGSA